MAKIPTYENRRSPTGRFTRPRLDDTNIRNAQKIVAFANDVLDEKAKNEGYEAGVEAQNQNLKEGLAYVETENQYTIAGSAFQKGANAAFIAGTQKKIKDDIYKIRTQYDGSTLENPVPNLDGFNADSQQLREDIMQNVPSQLQPDIANYLDSQIQSSFQYVNTQKLNYDKDEYVSTMYETTMSDIIDIENLITQNGFDDDALIENYASVVARIESLDGTLSPSKAFELKEALATTVKLSAIRNGYNTYKRFGVTKEEFINDIRNGGEIFQTIMNETSDVFGEGGIDLGRALSVKEQQSISNELYATFNRDKTLFAAQLDTATTELAGAIAVEKIGTESGYVFSADKFRELGVDEAKILELETEWENSQVAGGFVKQLETASITEHAQELSNVEKTINNLEVSLRTKEDADGNELSEAQMAYNRGQLLLYEGIKSSLETSLQNKKDIIGKHDGSDWQLVTNAGHTLDFSSPQAIEESLVLKKKITGVSAWSGTIMPKAQLEDIKNTIENASFNDLFAEGGYFDALDKQFGKYMPSLLKDLELDSSGMEHVFDMMQQGDTNSARAMYNGIKNLKEYETDLKKIYTGEGGTNKWTDIETDFSKSFNDKYFASLRSNPALFGTLYDGAYAHFVAKVAGGMEPTRAMNMTMQRLDNAYVPVKIEANGQTLLVPNNSEAFPINEIEKTLNDVLNNPQDYPIFSNDPNFTISDMVEHKDAYRFVIQGNQIFMVPEDTNLLMAPVYMKTPSGENEVNKTVVTVDVTNSATASTETNDVEKTQVFAKPDDWNTTFLTEMGDTKTVKGTERTEGAGARKDRRDGNFIDKQVPLEGKDKIDLLYEAFFEETQNEEGKIQYLDIHAGELTTNKEDKLKLHAISFYIKDGEIEDWMIDWLADNTQRLGADLSNPNVKQFVIENWKDNTQRTFKGEYGMQMSPLRALESFVAEIRKTVQATPDITGDDVMSDGEILLQGEAAQEALGLTEIDLTPSLDY